MYSEETLSAAMQHLRSRRRQSHREARFRAFIYRRKKTFWRLLSRAAVLLTAVRRIRDLSLPRAFPRVNTAVCFVGLHS